jgi:hypothetical protein
MGTTRVRDDCLPRFVAPPVLCGPILGWPFPEGAVPEDDNDPTLEWSPGMVLDWVAGAAAGPTSMTLLGGLNPEHLDPFDRVRLMTQWSRQIAHCEAMRLTAMAAVIHDAPEPVFVSHEIAAALHTTRPAADHLVSLCRRLARSLPGTAQALTDGRLTQAHAMVISDEVGPLPPDLAGQVEATVLPGVETMTVGQLRCAVRRRVAALDPDGTAQRHTRKRAEADVSVEDYNDGISGLAATMTTPDAAIITTAVDAWADAHRTQLPDLSVGQRRCAALLTWATDYLTHPTAPTRHADPSPSTSSSTSPPCSASPSTPQTSPDTAPSPPPSPAPSPPTPPGGA